MTAAFLAGFALDFLWCLYMRAVANGSALLAAGTSTAIGGLSALGVLRIVEDGWAVVPYLIGLFAGSLIAVKLGNK